MINLPNNIILSILFIFVLGVSCIKNDLEENDNDLALNPEYSLPIGSVEITLGEIVLPNLDDDTADIPKEDIFYYDGDYFRSPQSLFWRDIITFDFSKLTDNFDSIESLMLRVNVVNEIPAQSNLIVSFSNAAGTETDILFTNFIIESAQFSGNGNVIPSEQYKNDFDFDKSDILNFIDKKTININLQLTIKNPSDEIIQYISSQSLQIQLALRFSFESNPDEI